MIPASENLHRVITEGKLTHPGDPELDKHVAAEKKVRKWIQDNEELSLGERRVRVRELVERVERDLLR